MTAKRVSQLALAEKAYRMPLEQAQKILAEGRGDGLLDDVSSIIDRTDVDRLLIDYLDKALSDELPTKMTPLELNYLVIELAARLASALEEVRRIVREHDEHDTASGITELARKEGRLA